MVQSGLAEHTPASPGVGNAGQGAGLGLGSNNSAPNPGAARKERQWHRVPPPTSCALGDLTHCWSQDQTHGKTSYFSEANLGLAFCSQKKKKALKKNPTKPETCSNQKKGSIQALQLLQNPPALQSPSGTNTNRNKRLLTEGPQLCSSLVATQRGLLVPAWSTQLATLPPASTSLPQHHLQHYHVPLKWTPRLSHSRKNWSQTIPIHPCPSMAHQLLPFCYCAPKG